MKIEINLKACRYCRFFKCETDDGMDFLDEPFCSLNNEEVSAYESCDFFKIEKDVLKTIRTDYNSKFVKVLK